MTEALGLELSLDTEQVAVVRVSSREDRGRGHFHVQVLHYGSADGAVVWVAGRACWLDPLVNAALLPDLRKAGVWPHLLESADVVAASYQFKMAVRARQVTADDHPALKAAMMFAMRRPLTQAFAFDRLRSAADQSVLNAAAFGMFAARVPEPNIF
jgi:hypothetical protein